MSVDEYVKERSAQHLKALDWTQDRVMRLISLHSSGTTGGLGTSMIVMTIMMVPVLYSHGLVGPSIQSPD